MLRLHLTPMRIHENDIFTFMLLNINMLYGQFMLN